MPRTFGKQPIREVVWRAGYTHAEFADELGIKPRSHVFSAMGGVVPPSDELRQAASTFLGVPLADLFTAESLAEVCRPLPPGLRRKSAAQR
ncbi:hypothetical protein SAMN05661080_04942 [Modestobacter sp. DSM 44400]|uniref:helix-turn-helix domain-containing protein n=1 Tax=Modestobacter sp. DSM 44400 TaxID=1550230 RepID=UPI0008969221|nr:helix-turn-helix transcriptional regulator [Modestobacter sp. DSM 44400]SDY89564.1 hypothetical protein SAMN05661080_04942 [Modestobacter sp. DSM 44400]